MTNGDLKAVTGNEALAVDAVEAYDEGWRDTCLDRIFHLDCHASDMDSHQVGSNVEYRNCGLARQRAFDEFCHQDSVALEMSPNCSI